MAFLEPRREDGHADEQHKKSEYAESEPRDFSVDYYYVSKSGGRTSDQAVSTV